MGTTENPAEVRGTCEAPAGADRTDGLTGEQRVRQILADPLQPPVADALADRRAQPGEQPVQVTLGDEVRGGDRRGCQGSVIQMRVDVGVDLAQQGYPPHGTCILRHGQIALA